MKFAPFEEHLEALRQRSSEKEGLLRAVASIEASNMDNRYRLPLLKGLDDQIRHIGLEECDIEQALVNHQPLEAGFWPEVDVKFENGVHTVPFGEHADFGPKNGFSNYLCDVCGCILETVEQPFFMPDGSLSCEECYGQSFVKK